MRGFATLNLTSFAAHPCWRKGGKAILSKFMWYVYIHSLHTFMWYA